MRHVPRNDRGRVLERSRQEHGRGRWTRDTVGREPCHERLDRSWIFCDPLEDRGHTTMPAIHHAVDHRCEQEWYVAAFLDLDQIRQKEGAVDDKESSGNGRCGCNPTGFAPRPATSRRRLAPARW